MKNLSALSTIVIVASLFVMGCPTAIAPSANFFGSPTSGQTPLEVHFTNESEYVEGVTYFWTFGDGGTSTSRNPRHTYVTPGTYNVTLENRYRGDTNSYIRRGYIIVTAPPMNVPPIASFTRTPSSGPAPLTVTFTNNSTTGTGSNLTYSWNFGDGGTSSSTNPTHTYNSQGNYTTTLTVTTTHGSDSTSRSVTVTSPGGEGEGEGEGETQYHISFFASEKTPSIILDNKEEGDRVFISLDPNSNRSKIIGGGYVDRFGRQVTFRFQNSLPKYFIDDGWVYELNLQPGSLSRFDVDVTSPTGDQYHFENIEVDFSLMVDLINLGNALSEEVDISKIITNENSTKGDIELISAVFNFIGLGLNVSCCITGILSGVASLPAAICCISATTTTASYMTGEDFTDAGEISISTATCVLGSNLGDCIGLGLDILQAGIERDEQDLEDFLDGRSEGEGLEGTWTHNAFYCPGGISLPSGSYITFSNQQPGGSQNSFILDFERVGLGIFPNGARGEVELIPSNFNEEVYFAQFYIQEQRSGGVWVSCNNCFDGYLLERINNVLYLSGSGGEPPSESGVSCISFVRN